MENNNYEINTEVVAVSAAVSTGISLQANAHSTGLMFEQSVLTQQKDFQLSMGNSMMSAKKLVAKKIRYKEIGALRKGRFDK
ncbi:RebB family R body protein [Chryseobacterium sp.]|uniref:RebB family R body protein n=1 Tax=Chryseobacterium sp. TaxID=1871047 RepID=UPI0025B985D2|nr:RebB family R body protein [Chryseobacterium sp.]